MRRDRKSSGVTSLVFLLHDSLKRIGRKTLGKEGERNTLDAYQ